MRVRILGSAAGGGLPQWNCRCANCAAARAGSLDIQPRTQSSVAVSSDGRAWFLLNVSPDVRQQILAFPELWPPADPAVATRGTTVAGCVLTDAELDHAAGLLTLREGNVGRIFCTPLVRRLLNQYLPVEPILAHFASPPWTELSPEVLLDLPLPNGAPSGLRIRAFDMNRHIPRYVTPGGLDLQLDNGHSQTGSLTRLSEDALGSVVGLHLQDARTGGRLVYAPCVGSIAPTLRAAAREADCLLIDGTFWSNDEPIRCGIGNRTAREMGHIPVSGPEGSLHWLAVLPIRKRVYVHINNTNPMVNVRGPEHRLVHENGIQVGADGDDFEL